jgi:CDP-diacylglycerol--serine O-phosphatidyltransferase
MIGNLKIPRKALPNALTLGNGLCGVGGMIVLNGEAGDKISIAAALIFLGWLFDMVDGIAARKLGTTGTFGAMLDSLCDAITFGALPAVLIYARYANSMAILCAFIFASTALIRLARYTAQTSGHSGPRWYFVGLPSPSAAMMVASAALLHLPEWQSLLLGLIAAAAMVSTWPYADIPQFYVAKKWSYITLLIPLIATFLFGAPLTAAVILALYLVSGLLMHFVRNRKSRDAV